MPSDGPGRWLGTGGQAQAPPEDTVAAANSIPNRDSNDARRADLTWSAPGTVGSGRFGAVTGAPLLGESTKPRLAGSGLAGRCEPEGGSCGPRGVGAGDLLGYFAGQQAGGAVQPAGCAAAVDACGAKLVQQRPQLGSRLPVGGEHEGWHPQRVTVLDHDQPPVPQLLVQPRAGGCTVRVAAARGDVPERHPADGRVLLLGAHAGTVGRAHDKITVDKREAAW